MSELAYISPAACLPCMLWLPRVVGPVSVIPHERSSAKYNEGAALRGCYTVPAAGNFLRYMPTWTSTWCIYRYLCGWSWPRTHLPARVVTQPPTRGAALTQFVRRSAIGILGRRPAADGGAASFGLSESMEDPLAPQVISQVMRHHRLSFPCSTQARTPSRHQIGQRRQLHPSKIQPTVAGDSSVISSMLGCNHQLSNSDQSLFSSSTPLMCSYLLFCLWMFVVTICMPITFPRFIEN
jgi:hypothetical protein